MRIGGDNCNPRSQSPPRRGRGLIKCIMHSYDFLILGSGIAGLTAAHQLSALGTVLVVSKTTLTDNNTALAQGGIAAVRAANDYFKNHVEDTLVAGAFHNDCKAVEFLVERGPRAIRFLQSLGVNFSTEPNLEAGHSAPRVWHTTDFTGSDLLKALLHSTRNNRNITFLENHEALLLMVEDDRCNGTWLHDVCTDEIKPMFSSHTILATGGLGQLYAKTTNAAPATGDGLALALQAGLELKDMEFVQFHPTALDVPNGDRYFLLSEALRGFGGTIVNEAGEEFLFQHHPKGALAPRDVVTRGIFFEQKKSKVFLDLRHKDPHDLHKHFPNIIQKLTECSLDPAQDLIPITPVAHYLCGGIPTDLQARTRLPGLYAVGEVAHTGVHGANRLASNSLLEGVVFAQAIAPAPVGADPYPRLSDVGVLTLRRAPSEIYQKTLQSLRDLMWNHVGIVRTHESLEHAQKELQKIDIQDDRIQSRKLVCLAIVEACLKRRKSLGCHYMKHF